MDKYRIPSHRQPGWYYSANGMYFITLVTQHRAAILGKLVVASVQLSGFGQIVETEWMKPFEMQFQLFLDECVIMPDHIHAIIVLDKPDGDDVGLVDKH